MLLRIVEDKESTLEESFVNERVLIEFDSFSFWKIAFSLSIPKEFIVSISQKGNIIVQLLLLLLESFFASIWNDSENLIIIFTFEIYIHNTRLKIIY